MLWEVGNDEYPLRDGRWVEIYVELEPAPTWKYVGWKARLTRQRWWGEVCYRVRSRPGGIVDETYALWASKPRATFAASTLRRAIIRSWQRIEELTPYVLEEEGGMKEWKPKNIVLPRGPLRVRPGDFRSRPEACFPTTCRLCGVTLIQLHGHGACLYRPCPLYGLNQDECCQGDPCALD